MFNSHFVFRLLYNKTKKANNKRWKELNLIKIRKLMPQRRVL